VEKQGIEERKNDAYMTGGIGGGTTEEDAIPRDAGPGAAGLFKGSVKIATRLVEVTSYAHHAWDGGPYQLTFSITYGATGETWRISVTEEDLNIEEGASLKDIPMNKLKELSRKVIDQMQWVGEEGGQGENGLGIVFLALS